MIRRGAYTAAVLLALGIGFSNAQIDYSTPERAINSLYKGIITQDLDLVLNSYISDMPDDIDFRETGE